MPGKTKILAISASLRNARWGRGVTDLLDRIRSFRNRDELAAYVGEEARVHLQQFIDAGRAEGLPFDQLYENLRKTSGSKGLCNSEVGMAVALWAAHKTGCEIDYVPLSRHFTPDGGSRKLDELKEKLREADGLLMCTPVYFGDRSSLASDFVEMVRADPELTRSLHAKPMAGVSVGAKRNGGQETTLIYMLMEMTGLGMLGVGNDSDTTSQYGGTIKAGDVGTAAADEYGINTAIGTGRRLGLVARMHSHTEDLRLRGKLRVMFWILQEEGGRAAAMADKLIAAAGDRIEGRVLNLVEGRVSRCIACDICPISVGPDAEYRCIVTKGNDELVRVHEDLLDYDMIVPITVSTRDRSGLSTVYQRFIERTRYLRRGDYLFSDVVVMPMVIEEVGATENLHVRLLTSLIRHHTIMLKPNVNYIHNGASLNEDTVVAEWLDHLDTAEAVTKGRIYLTRTGEEPTYNPVGYVLSAMQSKELSVEQRRKALFEDREKRRQIDAGMRLVAAEPVDDVAR